MITVIYHLSVNKFLTLINLAEYVRRKSITPAAGRKDKIITPQRDALTS